VSACAAIPIAPTDISRPGQSRHGAALIKLHVNGLTLTPREPSRESIPACWRPCWVRPRNASRPTGQFSARCWKRSSCRKSM